MRSIVCKKLSKKRLIFNGHFFKEIHVWVRHYTFHMKGKGYRLTGRGKSIKERNKHFTSLKYPSVKVDIWFKSVKIYLSVSWWQAHLKSCLPQYKTGCPFLVPWHQSWRLLSFLDSCQQSKLQVEISASFPSFSNNQLSESSWSQARLLTDWHTP